MKFFIAACLVIVAIPATSDPWSVETDGLKLARCRDSGGDAVCEFTAPKTKVRAFCYAMDSDGNRLAGRRVRWQAPSINFPNLPVAKVASVSCDIVEFGAPRDQAPDWDMIRCFGDRPGYTGTPTTTCEFSPPETRSRAHCDFIGRDGSIMASLGNMGEEVFAFGLNYDDVADVQCGYFLD